MNWGAIKFPSEQHTISLLMLQHMATAEPLWDWKPCTFFGRESKTRMVTGKKPGVSGSTEQYLPDSGFLIIASMNRM